MQILPYQVSPTEYSLWVILEDQNIERILNYDPAEVTLNKLPGLWSSLRLKDIVLCYGTPKEIEEFASLAKSGKVNEALRILSRGFRLRPEAGDHDNQYESLI